MKRAFTVGFLLSFGFIVLGIGGCKADKPGDVHCVTDYMADAKYLNVKPTPCPTEWK